MRNLVRGLAILEMQHSCAPVIEPLRLMRRSLSEMPFPNHGSLVTSIFEMLRDIRHPLVELIGQRPNCVNMVVCACLHYER